MREILFRGKNDKGEWVYGWLGHLHSYNPQTKEISRVYFTEISEDFNSRLNIIVDYKTVGQYTGLTDKNGKKIFEGDVVKILYTDWVSQPIEDKRTLEEYLDKKKKKGVVTFAPYVGWYLMNDKYDLSIISGTHGYIEVIGNIHDNPELLRTPQNDEVRE